jgi:hypothetical protein
MFVTAQGSTYSQFKRALERRNFMLAWTMAAELPKVPLEDGLELLLLANDVEPARHASVARPDRTRGSAASSSFQAGRHSWLSRL